MRHAHIFPSRGNAPHVPRSNPTFPHRTITRRRGMLRGHNGPSSGPCNSRGINDARSGKSKRVRIPQQGSACSNTRQRVTGMPTSAGN